MCARDGLDLDSPEPEIAQPRRTTERGFCLYGTRNPEPGPELTTETTMDFSKLDGLIPAVVQDDESGEVLMVGFMNEEALALTRRDRLRHVLQPHAQQAVDEGRNLGQPAAGRRDMLVDCDDDTVLRAR